VTLTNKVIGLSGVAGSGKDLFFTLLSKIKKCRRISIADALKEEVNPWTKEHYGVNSVTCSREEKELIRPFLVFHANLKRGQSQGRHWINILDKNIKNLKLDDDEVLVITDIRFDHYTDDEVFWLKQELNGLLVHICNYCKVNSGGAAPPIIVEKNPANDSEKINDPKLKINADHCIRWEFMQKPKVETYETLTKKYIIPFAKKYLDYEE